MKHEKFLLFLGFLIATGLWTIVLQNAGVIQPVSRPKVNVANTVDVNGRVDVGNTVDINFSQLAGETLVSSEKGMLIGVKSTKNTVIPISWGEIEVK